MLHSLKMESQKLVINKMDKLQLYIENINKTIGQNVDISYDKTAYDIMHAQTRFYLDTFNNVIF